MHVAMETGARAIWISEQLQEPRREVIVPNVRELREISHSAHKNYEFDAQKLAVRTT